MHGNGHPKKQLAKNRNNPVFNLSIKMIKIIEYFYEKQKRIFLLDSIGALLTSIFLFTIIYFIDFFGIPKKELSYLSIIAFFFCIYSAGCYFFIKEDLTPFLRRIGLANLIYCLLTLALLIKYFNLLTIFEKAYFIVEIAVISGLSYVELKLAARRKGP
jgi:hypothetical protein